MKAILQIIAFVLLLGAALIGGYAVGAKRAYQRHFESSSSFTVPPEPIATVRTTPVRLGQIAESLDGFGSVIVEPGKAIVRSLPFESRVKQIFVTPGQPVGPDAPLFTVELSPDETAALDTARIEADAAEVDLELMQQRFEEHQATNTELSQAKQALATAKIRLHRREESLSALDTPPAAGVAGFVSAVNAAAGQIVAAGVPIVELATDDSIEVRLGFELAEIDLLGSGQEVTLSAVLDNRPQGVVGHIRLITKLINPSTRLADVFVALPHGSGFSLGQVVAGRATVASHEAMLVPRSALLPAGHGYELYLAVDGHAARREVTVGIDNGTDVEIVSGELKAGDRVITTGSAQVEDGMPVQDQSKAGAGE